MENLIWAKTILNVYSSIEKYILKIDATIDNISIMPEFSVDEVTTRIINLSDRKYSLINLKLIVETLIANCKPKYLRLLSLRHIQGLTMEQIAKHLEITERTCYRLYQNAIENFVVNMKYYGYTGEWLYKNLRDEKWILHEFYKEYTKTEKINTYKKMGEENLNIDFLNQFHSNLY